MLNREHSQITYEDLRRFLEHLRIEYRRYTLDHVSSSSRTIIIVDADFGSNINVGDVITINRNHKYALATQSAIQIESPLLVVICKISDTKLEVLSHGIASVTLQHLEDKSILYLGNDGRLTTTKEDNPINYAMGMYIDNLLLIYPRNLSENLGKDFLAKVGLGNVDNTSDMDKPISNAARAEFDRVMSTIRALDESFRRKLEEHIADSNIHITNADRNKWNSSAETIRDHINNEAIHISNAERSKWNGMTPLEKFMEHINTKEIHLVNHPASTIIETEEKQFVSKNDKNRWNNINTSITVTLLKSIWTSNKRCMIRHDYIKKDALILLSLPIGSSNSVRNMIASSNIICIKQEDGFIELEASTVPDFDVNIILTISTLTMVPGNFSSSKPLS